MIRLVPYLPIYLLCIYLPTYECYDESTTEALSLVTIMVIVIYVIYAHLPMIPALMREAPARDQISSYALPRPAHALRPAYALPAPNPRRSVFSETFSNPNPHAREPKCNFGVSFLKTARGRRDDARCPIRFPSPDWEPKLRRAVASTHHTNSGA